MLVVNRESFIRDKTPGMTFLERMDQRTDQLGQKEESEETQQRKYEVGS